MKRFPNGSCLPWTHQSLGYNPLSTSYILLKVYKPVNTCCMHILQLFYYWMNSSLGMSINTDTGQFGMSINTDTGQYDDGDCLYILYDHLLHCGKFWGSSTNKHYIIHHESTRLLILYFTSLEQNIAGSLKCFVFAFLINLYIVDVPLKQCHTK